MSLFSEDTSSTVLTISELAELVKAALNRSFGSEGMWVRGVVASYSANASGHHYLDLQEFDQESSTSPVATISCVIWKPKASYLLGQLALTSLGKLRNGLSLVVRVKPNYWAKGGRLSFQIEEIDVGLSQIANLQEKEKIRAKLRSLGIFEFNRNLEVPVLPLRIGLVTAQRSAAESDFLGELGRSRLPFVVVYRSASTAGDAAPSQIARSIELLQDDRIDLICLVRGGGSMSDLSVFDTEEVVSAVAGSAIPVWVGIGHSTDSTLVEEVANKSLDVPQSVARAVVARVQEFVDEVEFLAQRIQIVSSDRTELAGLFLSELASKVVMGPIERLHHAQITLNRLKERLHGSSMVTVANSRSEVNAFANVATIRVGHILSEHGRQISSLTDHLYGRSTTAVDRISHQIELLSRSIMASDPEEMASRGFSLIASESGQLIRDISSINVGQRIKARVGTGSFTATVDETDAGEADGK